MCDTEDGNDGLQLEVEDGGSIGNNGSTTGLQNLFFNGIFLRREDEVGGVRKRW